MHERITQEFSLLKVHYQQAEFKPEGGWVLLPSYQLPTGWNRPETPVGFQIPQHYPTGPPYGFYVPAGLMFNGLRPNNYAEPAPVQPPFGGIWAVFSWTTEDGGWHANAELTKGSNLLSWALGLQQRFEEGL